MLYFSTLTKTIKLYSIIIYFELKYLETNNRHDWLWTLEALTFIELLPSFTTNFFKSIFLTQESINATQWSRTLTFTKSGPTQCNLWVEPTVAQAYMSSFSSSMQLWLKHTWAHFPIPCLSLCIYISLPRTVLSTFHISTY